MSKGAFQTRLGQLGEIPNFQQTPPMAYSGNYFMPPKPNYLPVEKQAMARVQQPMSIDQQVPSLLATPVEPIQAQPQSLLQTPGTAIQKPIGYSNADSRISLPPINLFR
jgi:hypothetical protein